MQQDGTDKEVTFKGRKPYSIFTHSGSRYITVPVAEGHCDICAVKCMGGWRGSSNQWAGPCCSDSREDGASVAFIEIPHGVKDALAKDWAIAVNLLNSLNLVMRNGEALFRQLPMEDFVPADLKGINECLVHVAQGAALMQMNLLGTLDAIVKRKETMKLNEEQEKA